MKRLRLWATILAILLVVVGGLWLWWNFDLRWRPHTIKKDQAQIAKVLDTSGWVSPHLAGPRLYMISYGGCSDCIRFQKAVFPKLRAAGVDTRVIMIARPDLNGLAKSTSAERATVAELWLNRDWALFEKWSAVTPPDAWTAPGLPPADGDVARTAVIEAGRMVVEELRPLLKANGMNFAYPTVIWWTRDGVMRGCACEASQSYGGVEKDLGA